MNLPNILGIIFQKKMVFSLFLVQNTIPGLQKSAQTCSNSLYNLSMINIIYPGIDMLKLC